MSQSLPSPEKQPEVPDQLKDRVKASYDAIAHEYNAWTKDHWPLKTKYLDKLLAHIGQEAAAKEQRQQTNQKAPMRFLELGCGAGLPVLDTLLALDDRTTVVANDLSTTQVDLARDNLVKYNPDRIEYAPGDMTALSFAPDSFDGVIALYSICHLPPAEQVDMLRKIAGWVRPGGGVLVNVAEEASGGSTVDTWIAEDKGWMYWSGLGPEGTVQEVRESGLEVVEQVMDGGEDETFFWIVAMKTAESAGE